MKRFLLSILKSFPREPLVLVTALALAIGTWGFIEITDNVLEGDTQAFDEWAVRVLRRPNDLSQPIGPTWLAEAGRDVTALGGVTVLLLVIAAVAGFLWVNRGYRMLVVLLAATLSGILVSLALKQGFNRPRPDLVPHLSRVYTSSFPSGHSMMSAVVYLTLASIVSTTVNRTAMKIYVFVVAFAVILAIGVSRIYMGVHYPTDVLAGWIAGLVWALLSWKVTSRLQRSGTV